MKAFFSPSGKQYEFEPGPSLMAVAALAGVAMDGSCGGKGVCGKCKCKVKILSAQIENPGSQESQLLTPGETAAGYHLACLYCPTTDISVEIAASESVIAQKSGNLRLPPGFLVESGIRKVQVDLSSAPSSGDKTSGFAECLKEAAGLPADAELPLSLLAELPYLLRQSAKLTLTLAGNAVLDIEAGDATGDFYGLAVDIGTTTVVAYLLNLQNGEMLQSRAVTNPQWVYGADVISRISFAAASRENTTEIHALILNCFNSLACSLAEAAGVNLRHIYGVSVVGNTTMSHLFLGVCPRSLALAPFTPVFIGSPAFTAADLNLAVNSRARVWLLPNIAGHVGSDITAGILATGILQAPGYHLLIDIGTNGEIVLTGGERGVACSTAAGPAFEGATIYQGMRAADGAIEKITLDGSLRIQTIGNEPPVGICGSGVIDGIAELVEAGIIEKSGRMAEPEELQTLNLPPETAARLRDSAAGQRREFVLSYREGAEDIVLTQKDVREVQMAKGAIAAGAKILLDHFGVDPADLTCVHLTGAFGSHIDIASALRIGLLPTVPSEKVVSLGNAAGIGACLALLSVKTRDAARAACESVGHIELSVCPEFPDEYINAMGFENQDSE
ncbi:MAG: ASKHA domain-containing protein [Gracilibacteraceae bacterium]|jgi:uncharacterized 2Fe-2S/4Fe-4S cluster protein (DUF4445 family)|nr:ASKHA domain-containing protein [Gracilibacteraceae bacterium]